VTPSTPQGDQRARLEASGAAADRLPAGEPAGAPAQACPGPAAWIEVELVDEAGGPVRNEPFRLVLPDGSERAGKTDARGLARVEGIAAGECTLSFTALDADAWAPLD